MRKFFSKIHLWLSIPFGLIIFVICFSGATLVFEKEITEGLNRSLYRVQVEPGSVPMEPSALITKTLAALPDSLELSSLKVSSDPKDAWMMTFENTGRESLSVNPYTGEVNGWTKSYPIFKTMRWLHRWLLDVPSARGQKTLGKKVVGYSTIAMVLILITGFIIWIPKNRKALRYRLSVSMNRGWHRFWYDSHVALGFYALLFLLIMGLTGLTWSFGWYHDVVYGWFGVPTEQTQKASSGHHDRKKQAQPTEEPSESVQDTSVDYTTWDVALRHLQSEYREYQSISLSEGRALVAPDPQSYMRRNDVVMLDASGNIVKIDYYKDNPKSRRVHSTLYSLHTGRWGGLWTKWIYFLSALVGATLPLTGYYLWLRKKIKKRKK